MAAAQHVSGPARAITTALVLIGSGTAAFAYWSSTGMGSGTASTSTGAPNLTVTQASAPSGMAPGIDATAITATVTNNADSKAMVSQVVVSIASVTKALDAPAGTCDASDYTLSNPIMGISDRAAHPRAGMDKTLQALKNSAERGTPA